ncbi:anti-sigma factor [Marisediminicola sp. LYQ134]|uniref:anti-sigma factor n=1 Tax=unclassified Marisediminicola TaxID=2618316 RepID=UPI003983276C
MTMHSDPDIIAMIAMGETDGLRDDVEHIRDCPECAHELESLTRVADLARSGRPGDALATPDPEVWNRISQSLQLSPDVRPATVSEADAAAAPRAPETSVDVPLRERRRTKHASRRGVNSRTRTQRVLLGVSATLLAVGALAAVTAVVVGRLADPTPLASASLDPLDAHPDASGDATVEVASSGVRDVVVSVAGGPAPAGDYREVWLLNSDLDELISLGVLEGDVGRFTIPDGVDLADFPIVDVSVEPLDGDPAHSGDSIVRGTLDL